MLSRFATLGGLPGDPYWNNVSLLVVGNGTNGTTTNIKDSSSHAYSITVNGNTVISTAQSKFGSGSSILFDGITDYLDVGNTSLVIQGSTAFTLEAWIYPTSVSGDLCIYDTRTVGGSGFVLFINSTGKLQVFDSGGMLKTASTTTLVINSWQFISLVRTSGSSVVTYYVNGTAAGTFTLSSFAAASSQRIGARNDTLFGYAGYMYDFRCTNGVARYTASNTPPPFPPTAPMPTY
jgi:hypothetical protein